jgi:hypothetical protein
MGKFYILCMPVIKKPLHMKTNATKENFSLILLSSLLISFFSNALMGQSGISVTTVQITHACKDDGSATLSVTGGVPPYAVYWMQYLQSPFGSGMDTVATGLSVSGLKPGYYQVKVLDSSTPNPLQAFHTVWIQSAFNLRSSITPATCSNSDGKIRVDVFDTSAAQSGPYSYQWSNGINNLNSPNMSDSISNIPAGNYTIKVTNGNGCYVSGGSGTSGTSNPEGFMVWSNSPITTTTSATPSNCFDGTATVIAANGVAPYSYIWNTIPIQTGSTASGLSPGFKEVTVTDASGCSRKAFVSVPAGPNYLQASSNIIPEVCEQGNGAIQMTITGGQGPYTFIWSNGSTTEDINGLSSGYYHVEITDNQGCKLKASKHVLRSSPLQVDINGTIPGCGLSNGEVAAIVSGGMVPYNYSWNNGASTNAQYSNIPRGYYFLQVTDANGCKGSDFLHLKEAESCKAVIKGRVFNDLNGNCVADPGEGGLANVIVNAGPGHHYASTDQLGFYSISVETGTYDVSVSSPVFWDQQCPSGPSSIQVNASSPGSVYAGNHFYLVPDSVFNDLQVFVSSGPARPGFNMTWYITVRNAGTTTLTPTLDFTHDPIVNYQSSTPNAGAYHVASRTLSWNVSAMSPQSTRNFYVITKLPVNAALGDSVRSTAQINIAGFDVNLKDNTDYYARLITGSYDPNDKLVRPAGVGDEGKIEWADSVFTYRVRFQNTGTDTAFTVIIRDTLDQDLNIPSFKLRGTSHPVEYTLSGAGVLEFVFNQILLPDSNINEPASHGFIEYTIKRKSDIPMGTRITNSASIYFDFNPPIHTNTTLNTLYDATVQVQELHSAELNIWPNPTASVSKLILNNQEESPVKLSIHDASGRLVYYKDLGITGAGNQYVDLHANMCNGVQGIYMITIETGNQKQYAPWVISY